MNEIEIRQALLVQLGQDYQSDPDTIIVEELGLCQGEARIDIAVMHSTFLGFEIKSEHDTLNRLPRQVKIYGKILEQVTLVTCEKHLSKSLKIIPNWWGVIIAKAVYGKVNLHICRECASNPSLDPSAVVQLLWREEAYNALKQRGLHRGLATKPRKVLWRTLVDHTSLEELLFTIRRQLLSRTNWRAAH